MTASVLDGDTFTCAACGHTFKKGWSDEEAREEAKASYNINDVHKDCVLVCEDCAEIGDKLWASTHGMTKQ